MRVWAAASLLPIAAMTSLIAASTDAQNADPFREVIPPAPAPKPVPKQRFAPAPEPEPTPPPIQPTPLSYDGNYKGMETLLPNMPSWCGGPFERTLSIRNSEFSFIYNRTRYEWVKGSVSADGTVSGFGTSSSGGNKITGKIRGNELVGTIGSYICSYALDLKKQ
jgi:hypothetical protein